MCFLRQEGLGDVRLSLEIFTGAITVFSRDFYGNRDNLRLPWFSA